MAIQDQILNQIGDWNPQLFRELKGKLKNRNLLICLAIALLAQIMFIAFFTLLLPDTNAPVNPNRGVSSSFCFSQKEVYGDSNLCSLPLKINWEAWWLEQFLVLSWSLPSLIGAAAGAFLVIDIAQESSRGTLNFIRLSPQSGRSILWGKLLGVPSLVYFLLLLIMPLHLVTAIGGGVSGYFLVSYYLMLSLGFFMLHSLAMLLGLMVGSTGGTNQLPIVAGVAVGFLYLGAIPSYMILNSVTTWAKFNRFIYTSELGSDLQWFMISIAKNPWTANLFAIISVLIVSQAIWSALERKFNIANRQILSKRQAYICIVFFQLFILGFFVQNSSSFSLSGLNKNFEYKMMGLFLLNALSYIAFLTLIFTLTPQRQALLDWLRYRHLANSGNKNKRSLWQDLVWHENSPSVVAIGICSLISAIILLPWAVWDNQLQLNANLNTNILKVFISQILSFVILAIVYQSLVFWAKNKQQQIIAIVILLTLVIVPPLFLYFTSLPKTLWIIAGYPAASWRNNFELSVHFLKVVFAQIGILSFFSFRLKGTLSQASLSQSKQIMLVENKAIA
jgi:hypothetical protein